MNNEMVKTNSNVTEHLANERTFLAWVRTGIGIMAFGFAVVKFSLFVRQLETALTKSIPVNQKGYSAEIGILLVAVGGVVTILAYFRYKKAEREISRNEFHNSSKMILALTVVMFVISALLIGYLIQSL